MKNCSWKRARSDEQKKQRIKEIISATERLYQKSSYPEITFVRIAEEAGFTRSNLYKYFKSKEEIFLEFLIGDIRLWKSELKKNFPSKQQISAQVFADKWVKILNNNQRLTELTSILYLHLEKEATFEYLLKFKKEFNEDYFEIVQLLNNSIAGLTEEKVAKFLNLQTALIIGIRQTSDLSENQAKIIERPEFSHYKIDFDEILKDGILYILNGILNQEEILLMWSE